jgi:hypothetical protein
MPTSSCSEARGRGEQRALVGAELVRVVPADQTGTRHPAAGGQRQDGETAGADIGERRFQGRSCGPDGGAPLDEGRLQRGHGAYGRVGPFRAPFGAPHLGPGVRFGRVEEGDDETVALEFGEGDPVGPQGAPQRGHHGSADVTDGARGGEGRGEPLDAGHVADTGAQLGGVGDGSHEVCRTPLSAGHQTAAQP